MATVEMDLETSVEPDRVRGALVDFSPRRPELWPGVDPALYEVYTVGDTSADIKEGGNAPGGKIWAKEHYDWSDPQTVKWTVLESNFCAPGGRVAATITPRSGGGSKVHIEWERTGTTFMGRFIAFMVKLTGGKPVAASFKKGLAKLENAATELAAAT